MYLLGKKYNRVMRWEKIFNYVRILVKYINEIFFMIKFEELVMELYKRVSDGYFI